VLISALDDSTADALLDQMDSQQAAKVRCALMELDDIPAAEQQSVLSEFLQQQNASAADTSSEDVSLELNATPEPPAAVPEQIAAPTISQPLAFLQDVAPQYLARALQHEQSQTIAVIITQLPPEQAAALLERLPPDLATLALERLAWPATPTPESLADLARELRTQLGPHLRSAATQCESLDKLSAVLSAMPGTQRQQALANLAARDAGLVGRLSVRAQPANSAHAVAMQRYRIEAPTPASEPPPLVDFDQLPQLDDDALRQVLAEADPQLTLLALTGADQRLAGRILRKLPTREAAVLRQRLEHPGPVRLRELDEARSALAAIASRLAREGQIELPPSLRFAAAA